MPTNLTTREVLIPAIITAAGVLIAEGGKAAVRAIRKRRGANGTKRPPSRSRKTGKKGRKKP